MGLEGSGGGGRAAALTAGSLFAGAGAGFAGFGVGVDVVFAATFFGGGLVGAEAFAAFDSPDLVCEVLRGGGFVTALFMAPGLLDTARDA